MALKEDLETQSSTIFNSEWTTRTSTVVPVDSSLTMGNHASELDSTVFYADLAESTNLVDKMNWEFAAEIYKVFLHCAAKIIHSEGGEITAYDGDRVMAVFIGNTKNTSAVRAALKLNYACLSIIQPAINKQYSTEYVLRHKVGIDSSKVRVTRTGIRGANDLVWVGRAANWAAKLSSFNEPSTTWITHAVFNIAHESVKVTNGQNMWQARPWTQMNDTQIYGSNWWWRV